MGEKVGKAKAESPKEVEGNVIFGEESLKTGGKGDRKVFHGGHSFREEFRCCFYGDHFILL